MKFLQRYSALPLLLISILVSFLGSIPPGTTNVIILQLATHNIPAAILFVVGCLVGEMIYVTLCVVLMNRLLKFQWVMHLLEWISFGILITLASFSFFAATNHETTGWSTGQLTNGIPFVSGLVMMLINPVQIPFWLGWTTVLMGKNLLKTNRTHHIVYVAGSGIGSLAASLMFIMAGAFLSTKISMTGRTWHMILGSFFLFSAAYQLKIILSKRVTKTREVMERPHLTDHLGKQPN